jgi:hypothetical protein
MIMVKKAVFLVCVLFVVMLSVSSVLAITARLQNGRAVLRADEVGEVFDRYVTPINSNDVPVTVDIYPSGDLVDDVNVLDNNFVLQPGEEKRARFTIKASRGGATETKINVVFTPEDGDPVGLAATLVIIAPNDGLGGLFDGDDGADVGDEVVADAGDDGFSFNPSGVPDGLSERQVGGISGIRALGVLMIVLVAVFVVLVVYYKTKVDMKKGSRRYRV